MKSTRSPNRKARAQRIESLCSGRLPRKGVPTVSVTRKGGDFGESPLAPA